MASSAESVAQQSPLVVSGEGRRRIVQQIGTSEMFALAVRKCVCTNYVKWHVFEKDFLRFRHLNDLYPGHPLFFDAAARIPVPVHDWSERRVAETLSEMNIRPSTGVDDLLAYRLYLCCSQDGGCPQKAAGLPAPARS